MIHNTCNMTICDLPDIYALRPRAYISGKSLMSMLQLLLKDRTVSSHKSQKQGHAVINKVY